MSEATTGTEGTALTNEELLAGIRESQTEMVTNLTAGLTEALKGAGAGDIDRSKVTKPGEEKRVEEVKDESPYDEVTRAYGEAVHGQPAIQFMYDRLPEQERKVRSIMGDQLITSWVRASINKDEPRLAELRQSPAFQGHTRDMSVGTSTEGGNLAPAPLSNYIAVLRDKMERIAPRSLQFTSESTTLGVPTESAVGAVAKVAENAAMSSVDSTFGKVNLTKVKAGRYVLLPYELVNDASAAFGVVNMLGRQCSRKLAAYWDAEFATKADANITEDLESASIATVTATGAMTRKKLTDVILGLGTEWRAGGDIVLMGNATLTGFLSEMEDTTGRPLYQTIESAIPVSDTGRASGIVEGLEYLEVPFATDILMVGRLSEGYGILMDGGLRVETDSSVAFASDQIALRVLERRDGAVLQAAAFKKSSGTYTAPA